MSADVSPPVPIRRRLPADPWLWAAILGLSFLLRPYRGLFQDARIYIGRTLADLDPGGIGRDLMFAYDAQTDFSLFPRLALAVVQRLGPEAASMLLTGAALTVWTVALVLLARRLAAGRLGWAVALAMLVLAATYGAYDSFSYGESWATPRAWAEAGVMAGFAAILAGRWRWAVAALGAAVLFHPLMTLPALAVALAVKAQEDRRWAWLFPAGAAGAVLAALLGLPIAERLLQPMDPAWLQALRLRSAYLFPDLWSAEEWARATLQLATVLMGARFLTAEARRLYLGAAAAGVLGVAAAALCALYPSQLLLQLQPWRALWLLALLANGGLIIALAGLWREGGLQRLAMWGFVCALLAYGSPVGAAIGWMVLLLSVAAGTRAPALSQLTQRLMAVPAAVLALLYIGLRAQSLVAFMASAKAAGAPMSWPYVLAPELHVPVLIALALIWALRGGRSQGRALQAAAIVLVLAAVATWDSRSAAQRDLESGRTRQAFSVVSGLPAGAVYWADGDIQTWLGMGRPQWVSLLQGGPMLFSRDLALQLSERTEAVVDLGLANAKMRSPFTTRDIPALPVAARPGAVQALCRRPDAPAAVVLAGRQPWAGGTGSPAAYVDLPRPYHLMWDTAHFRWVSIRGYTVVRCLSAPPSPG